MFVGICIGRNSSTDVNWFWNFIQINCAAFVLFTMPSIFTEMRVMFPLNIVFFLRYKMIHWASLLGMRYLYSTYIRKDADLKFTLHCINTYTPHNILENWSYNGCNSARFLNKQATCANSDRHCDASLILHAKFLELLFYLTTCRRSTNNSKTYFFVYMGAYILMMITFYIQFLPHSQYIYLHLHSRKRNTEIMFSVYCRNLTDIIYLFFEMLCFVLKIRLRTHGFHLV
jgi:hypothetical protein